jgi:putative SOS response-associated peptidase YedK
MCFTVNVNLIKEELENRYGATLIDPDKYRPSYYYHAFVLPSLPAICSGDPSKIKTLKWGLIPSWTTSRDQADIIRYKTFNARSESIDTKPSFSSSFQSKRCLIPVIGFFEWQHTDEGKIPWYIYHAENEIISLAGIYDDWNETTTGEVFSTFSIVTTEANELMAQIHNSGKRMPVILSGDGEKRWIDLSTSRADAMNLLLPYPSEIIKAHTISPLINSKSLNRNTPELIQPYNYSQENLLF